jgi:hypothetical protein
MGTSTCSSLLEMYPNPISEGCACAMKEFVLTCRGGSAKGDTLSMGEWTEVASAKRGVRGCLSEESEDELDDLVRTNGAGRLFSGIVAGRWSARSATWLAAELTGHFDRKDRRCLYIYKDNRGNRRRAASGGAVGDAFDEGRRSTGKCTRGGTRGSITDRDQLSREIQQERPSSGGRARPAF